MQPSAPDEIKNDGGNPGRKYYFCLSQGFSMYSYSCTIDVLRAASLIQSSFDFETKIVAHNAQSITCGNGTRVLPDLLPNDMKGPAALVVIAGTGATSQDHTHEVATVRLAKSRGFEIWGISSGIIPLARSGILDGQTAAVHWQDRPYINENFPKILLSEKIFERGPKLSTCVGGAAASDMVLHHLSEMVGGDLGANILALLNIETRRSGKVDQLGPATLLFPTRNMNVLKAIQIMQQNLYRRPSIPTIAATVGLSQKQLERLFKKEFDQTPRVVFERICMEHARREVVVGQRPIILIARDYGFGSSAFSTKYRLAFGITPSQDRQENSEKL